MKILILGGTGILGSDLVKHFAKKAEVIAPTRMQIDLLNLDSVAKGLREIRPDRVINATAYTQVDGAETENELATALNVTAVKQLTELSAERRIPFIHFSTDQVFDGTATEPYLEEAVANPLNNYARTKWEGEKIALSYPNSLVLRVQWLYGDKKDRFSALRDKTHFSPFLDQLGAPTPTDWLAEIVDKLTQQSVSGLYHATLDNHASWADVFAFAKRQLNLSVRLEPKYTHEVKLPARRPLYSVLSNSKLKKSLGVSVVGQWEEKLAHFLARK